MRAKSTSTDISRSDLRARVARLTSREREVIQLIKTTAAPIVRGTRVTNVLRFMVVLLQSPKAGLLAAVPGRFAPV